MREGAKSGSVVLWVLLLVATVPVSLALVVDATTVIAAKQALDGALQEAVDTLVAEGWGSGAPAALGAALVRADLPAPWPGQVESVQLAGSPSGWSGRALAEVVLPIPLGPERTVLLRTTWSGKS